MNNSEVFIKTGRRKPNLRSQLWARMVTRTTNVHCTQAEPETHHDMITTEMTNLQDKVSRFRKVLDFARGRHGAGENFPSGLGALTARDEEVTQLKNRLLKEIQGDDGLSEDTKEMLAKTQYGNMRWLWMCRCGGGLDPGEWICASPLQLGLGSTTRTWWYHGDPRTSDCGRLLEEGGVLRATIGAALGRREWGIENLYEHMATDRSGCPPGGPAPHGHEENRQRPCAHAPPFLMYDPYLLNLQQPYLSHRHGVH